MAKMVWLSVLLAIGIAGQTVCLVIPGPKTELDFVGSTATKRFYAGPWTVDLPLTWMKAQELCNQNQPGMRLGSLETSEEVEIALKYVEGNEKFGSFWISATDFGSEGDFHWTKSGKALGAKAQSNNRERNCLSLQEFNGLYIAEPCATFEHPYVWALCEIDNTDEASTTTTAPSPSSAPTSTPEPIPTTTTLSPIPTTPAPFECPSEGKHPDPQRCDVFHECVLYNGDYIDSEFTCPEFTTYCAKEEECGHPVDCPCDTGVQFWNMKNGLKTHDTEVFPADDLELVGHVGSKQFYTAKRPNVNWISAMEFCHQNEMMLARMETEEERSLLVSYLSMGWPRPKYFWLSGVDFGTEGEYYWINNGTSLYMTPYGNGGRDSNCLYLSSLGPLYDWSCENHQNYEMWPVCEVEINN